jgi:hypothetical protein
LLLLRLELNVEKRITAPPNKEVAGSSVFCKLFVVVPHLAGRGGEVVRRCGEVGVGLFLSACREGEGEKQSAAPSFSPKRSWMGGNHRLLPAPVAMVVSALGRSWLMPASGLGSSHPRRCTLPCCRPELFT